MRNTRESECEDPAGQEYEERELKVSYTLGRKERKHQSAPCQNNTSHENQRKRIVGVLMSKLSMIALKKSTSLTSVTIY